VNTSTVKDLLLNKDSALWTELASLTSLATGFEELVSLSSLRRKAVARDIKRPGTSAPLKLAIIGGCSLYPLHELLTHLLETAGISCELFIGEYDNYVAEIVEEGGSLYQFRPQAVFLLPGMQRCKHPGALDDSRETVQIAADAVVSELLDLCRMLHERTSAELVLGNFMLPARHDLGPFRSRTLASDWNFRKWVNLELGTKAPSFVRICDLEFLSCRHGTRAAEDARGWFESKQPCSPSMLVEVCREAVRLILGLRSAPKKVLVLDLDNTLWGGVVSEDGIEGIEIGDTSPRGEAFKAFQRQIAALRDRGVLLAVCSKNDHARALEPFEKHPEMVLRAGDFVAFEANWEPKSDNIRRMAHKLGLGLDSFVFIDDNPAEIEIVRQFAPEVTTILLGPDPAEYAGQLQDCRLFEAHHITTEDAQRTRQYRAESERQALLNSTTDMDSYLESLEMEGVFSDFASIDVPRLAQLINKSNQFNLTTRRRSESEVQSLIGRPGYVCFSMRLQDRFGDHGLISIIIGQVCGDALEIDTWLMSCRVLKRQVEETVLNELVRHARKKGCSRLEGVYLPTPKNEMVREFYPRMGFTARAVTPERGEYTLCLDSHQPTPTRIVVRYGNNKPS
jgi:FkbH-like protein